ncbi:hypothetical protein HYALB_00011558 [Hymenoscyphus albidus]|uniref:Uncharacterized protein n=1 Tax=Hymenoscyphus albidus TaxID=595503 RepID=A0A9N9PZK5_9HELO|nr:hypothetical protein HYALB_00011558 [Hymenoscyphus albidus]
MSKHALRPRADICHFCDFLLARPTRAARPRLRNSTSRSNNTTTRLFSARHPNFQGVKRSTPTSAALKGRPFNSHNAGQPGRQYVRDTSSLSALPPLEQAFEDVVVQYKSLLSTPEVPSEGQVNSFLASCERVADLLVAERSPNPLKKKENKDLAASALLKLDDPAEVETPFSRPPAALQRMQDELSKMADEVISHPPVFISPQALEMYVYVQATLKKPEFLAKAFYLYANKPIAQEGSSPIKYKEQNPDKVSNAVPKPVADRALEAAIDANDLDAAMDLVAFSYATKAFRRAKFIRLGLVPAIGVVVAPVSAYAVASQLAHLQTTMETGMATNVAFTGLVAYLGFTATIGIVALTTANDQMDRVTWTPGLPLRERWIREDERAAIDRIAGAWGFREIWKRGEEEGEEWDTLREWIGLKGMILDRTELMEGME